MQPRVSLRWRGARYFLGAKKVPKEAWRWLPRPDPGLARTRLPCAFRGGRGAQTGHPVLTARARHPWRAPCRAWSARRCDARRGKGVRPHAGKVLRTATTPVGSHVVARQSFSATDSVVGGALPPSTPPRERFSRPFLVATRKGPARLQPSGTRRGARKRLGNRGCSGNDQPHEAVGLKFDPRHPGRLARIGCEPACPRSESGHAPTNQPRARHAQTHPATL